MITQFRGDYAFLSNFWPSRVTWDNIEYPSVEHAYQAAKSLDPEVRARVRAASSSAKAKSLGRKIKLRPDWERVREPTMRMLLQRKFEIPRLRESLDATGDQQLVEGNEWGDTYWGVCNGEGENRLGKLLMEIRDANRKNKDR